VRHGEVDIDHGGVFERGGEEVLLLARGIGAIPFELAFGEHLARGQRVVEQGGGLVQGGGELHRAMHALARGLAGLGIARNGDDVVDLLDEDLVLMAFLPDIADGILGEGALGDRTLGRAFDGDVSGGRHGGSLVGLKLAGGKWIGAAGAEAERRAARLRS
jgi:hypothetical protein